MASNVPNVRFVRCPKCQNVIAEFASIPVYQCGGCDTVLRAKYHIANEGLLETSAKNTPEDGSSSSGLASSGQKAIDASLETNHLNKEVENPLKLSHDSSEASDKIEESVEPVIDRGLGDKQGDSLRSESISSRAYYGSASSPDDGGNDRVPNKFRLLSRRTFRNRNFSDAIDSKGKSITENRVVNNEAMTPDADSDVQSDRYDSTTPSSSDSIRAELPSRNGFDALERESSFGSEDFRSEQNWKEPEKAKLSSLRPDHMKILKKVNELRDELTELFDQTVEGKKKYHLKSIREEEITPSSDSNLAHLPGSYLPSKNGQAQCSCLHCKQEVCRSPKHELKKPHMDYIPPLQYDKAQLKKPHVERRQPVRRYCRPASGGAPFVICHNCLKLLQLPADFLISRRRLHKLQCGACSEVLLYSFRDRARMVLPQTPAGVPHPPSEVDNGSDSMARHEDYVLSFSKSDSAEPEPVLHVSRSSSYQMEGQNDDQVNAPQLHRLLGYASASEILYRFSGSDEGDDSTEPATPRFYWPSEGIDSRDDTDSPLDAVEISEEVELPRRSRGVIPLRELLKKGIRELNHGLDSVKLKIQSHGRTIPAS